MKLLIWNNKLPYELQVRKIMIDTLKAESFDVTVISTIDPFFKHFNLDKLANKIINNAAMGEYRFDPDAIMQRDEHGCLYTNEKWFEFIGKCRQRNVLLKSMVYDFGYFDHYNTLAVDIHNQQNKSSIASEWNTLSEQVIWENTTQQIQNYKNKLITGLTEAKNKKPIDDLPKDEYVVIWPQQFMSLLRPEFREGISTETEVSDWTEKVCNMVISLGLKPVVKVAPNFPGWNRFNLDKVAAKAPIYLSLKRHVEKYPKCKFHENMDAKLLAHAKFHIVSCTTATNMMVLAEAPVIAMGRSWFTGLNIFNEPTNWESLLSNPLQINIANRNKWINWWLNHQIKTDEVHKKILELYQRY